MLLISKLLRAIDNFFDNTRNALVLIKLRLKYPAIAISGKTVIEKGCSVVAEDGSSLILKNAYISSGTIIRSSKGSVISIHNSFVGRSCVIVSKVHIEINENCEIAEMVVIRDQNHKHDLTQTEISKQGFTSAPIKIGANVWIGCKTTILMGVEIGSNSVIGAHSLVNKNIPKSSLAFGIPVKTVKPND